MCRYASNQPLDETPQEEKAMKTFITELWSRVFSVLRWVSLFQIIRACIPALRESRIFVDAWVLGNSLFAILFLAICSAPSLRWWELVIIVYGAIRVIEVVVYQINVLLFDEYRAKKAGRPYALRSYRRIVILSLHNYVEVVFWFAIIYRNLSWAFQVTGPTLDSFFASLNLSFVTMTTFGQTRVSPIGTLGEMLILSQSVIGLFMALVVLARFISLLPEVETLDEFER
jgi:hypothetical protein